MNKLGRCKTACAVCVLGAAAVIAAPAQTIPTLVNFDWTNGFHPLYGALAQGLDGNLYGTTYQGGPGNGEVFEMTSTGTLTRLFGVGPLPSAGLIVGMDGSLYGTDYDGSGDDLGTVFKITPEGAVTVLHQFEVWQDGSYPLCTLVQAPDGTFYGTTYSGGRLGSGPIFCGGGCGTAFKVTPGGAFTSLYDFCSQTNCTDGVEPIAGLVQGLDGDLYGTTSYGGAHTQGTVFKITPSGTLTTLHTFGDSSPDGANPAGAMLLASDGNLYGTTVGGGGGGTVFKVTPDGTVTTFYSFCSLRDCLDGKAPQSALIQATDGNLYGTTLSGGANGQGTVFRLTLGGTLTTLHSFDYSPEDSMEGYGPYGALVQATNGKLYGTTFYGGTYDDGTVFGLDLGLGPFVETVPGGGKTGQSVMILGTNLSGATSVTFNGTPATFTVRPPSAIRATIPVGATTGPVQVVTPSGTLTSNVSFQVLP